ncbi:MAG: Gfo/Idh/MocA family oxidoreductase [Caldilineaceae bacterium]|nr:Gfo/Idh/MocA family oxidoreductase [Caldilineaceae bacterium]
MTPPLPDTPRPIVLIGAGGIVRDAHLPAYQKAGFPVVGIYDLDEEKARALAAQFAIQRVYSSLTELCRSAPADAVFDVAVPASALVDVLPILPDRRGVLIQKPMGESLADARAIRAICHQKELAAGVNFQLRYAPFVLAARDLIERGAIGEITDMEIRLSVYTPWHLWRFLENVANMEVYYHSIHYLDLMRAFLGNPQGVYAKVTNHPDAPKMDGTRSAMILDYGSNLRATISTNHFHRFGLDHQESILKWEGTKGAIKITMGLLLNYPVGEADQFDFCLEDEQGQPRWQRADIPGTWFPDAFVGPMASVMRRLDHAQATIPTSVDDALETMALVDAVCRSSRDGALPLV